MPLPTKKDSAKIIRNQKDPKIKAQIKKHWDGYWAKADKADKKKAMAKKMPKKKSFIDRLEEHKREGASFDDGTWTPKKKGQSFIQALERHKSQRDYD